MKWIAVAFVVAIAALAFTSRGLHGPGPQSRAPEAVWREVPVDSPCFRPADPPGPADRPYISGQWGITCDADGVAHKKERVR